MAVVRHFALNLVRQVADKRSIKSRRKRAAKRKKRLPFLPDFHDLEKRMMPATFMVLNTADSGAGSLRQAILDSNASPGLNLIDFDIGAVGSQQTISPSSALPGVTNPVFMDGWSQGGAAYSGAPLVFLDGALLGTGANGLDFAAGSQDALVVGGVAGHADDRPVGVSVCLGVEGPDVLGGVGNDRHAELFVDLADEGVDVGEAGVAAGREVGEELRGCNAVEPEGRGPHGPDGGDPGKAGVLTPESGEVEPEE